MLSLTVVELASRIVSTLGIIAGAAWVLYNFGLQRIAKPQVRLRAKLISVREQPETVSFVHMRATATNQGRTAVPLKGAIFEVQNIAAETRFFLERLDYEFKPEQTYRIFMEHNLLEPGEFFSEDLVVTAPTGSFMVARFRYDTSKRRYWSIKRRSIFN